MPRGKYPRLDTKSSVLDRLLDRSEVIGQMKEHTDTVKAYRTLTGPDFYTWLLNRYMDKLVK